LLSRIKQASKAKNLHTEVNWVQVGNGFLAIGHKPGGKISFEGLKNEGTSAVLTLLNENEGAPAIGKQSRTVNIDWIWFPFSASKPHDDETVAQVYSLYSQLSSLINSGAKIYIHCSAGIHRTGMITYGFLRFLGSGKTEAFGILESLREVTAAQVGEDRLLWADQFDSTNHNQI
jgi:protein-tyrosine phosphatase